MMGFLDGSNPVFWIIICAVLLPVLYLVIRPFTAYLKFVYPNAKYEAMGNPFISKNQLDSLMDAKNLGSFVETVNSKKNIQLKGETVDEIHQGLHHAWQDTIAMMKHDTSKALHPLFDAFLYQQDVELIVQAVKQKLFNIPFTEDVTVFLPKTKQFINQLNDKEKEDLPGLLETWGFSPVLINELSSDTPRFIVIDVLLYQHGIRMLQDTKVPYKADKPKQFLLKTMLDLTNIKMALRAKQRGYDAETCSLLFIGEGRELPRWKFEELCDSDNPQQLVQRLEGTSYYNSLSQAMDDYEHNKSIQWFEIALDRFILHAVKELSLKHYLYLGPILRFLFSRQFEIQNLRVLAKGISEQMPSGEITPLLVWEDST